MKILLLGAGRWGNNHLRVLRSLPVELFVVDLDERMLKKCLDLGIPDSHLSVNLQTFIAEIDAAVVVTPAQTHFVLCEELLKLAKDVFVDKPISLFSSEAMTLTKLADKNLCILQVGHIFRYDSASQWLHKAIHEGKFGHINILRGNFSGFKNPRNDTGVAFADAIHFVDLFNYFMAQPPVRVTAQIRDFIGRGMEDELFITMDYESDIGSTWAKVEAGYHIPGKHREVFIVGTKLSAFCDYNILPHEIKLYDNKRVEEGGNFNSLQGIMSQLKFSTEEPLLTELKAFLDSVQTRMPPLANGREGYESVRVLEAALESAKSGRSIELKNVYDNKKTHKEITLSQCFVDDEVRQSILRVVDSGRYILDKECVAFEQELAVFTGVKHAVLCSSCTMATFMLHQVMGLKRGDEILVPSHTAFASIEPMLHFGAKPVFIDIDDSYCLDVDQLEVAITQRTVGILPVHLYGHPADLDRIAQIAQKYHLWVIEDCAQAQGAKYKGRRVGSMGMASVFSFFPSKNLTVLGDGGCICTNDDVIAEKVRMLRNHGRKDKYTHEMVGYNLRFNEIQAAIGRVGLRQLGRLNERRRKAALRYNERLKDIIEIPLERSWVFAIYHMYVVRVPEREELRKFLQQHNINTGIHYPIAIHQQPAMLKLYDQKKLLVTEKVVKEILSLPIHGEISLEEVDYVCDCIVEFYKK